MSSKKGDDAVPTIVLIGDDYRVYANGRFLELRFPTRTEAEEYIDEMLWVSQDNVGWQTINGDTLYYFYHKSKWKSIRNNNLSFSEEEGEFSGLCQRGAGDGLTPE